MEIAIFVVLGVVLVIIVASYFTQTIIPKIDIDTPQDPALELKAEVFVSEKLSPKKTPRPRKKK
jgi:hypothetical protein